MKVPLDGFEIDEAGMWLLVIFLNAGRRNGCMVFGGITKCLSSLIIFVYAGKLPLSR